MRLVAENDPVEAQVTFGIVAFRFGRIGRIGNDAVDKLQIGSMAAPAFYLDSDPGGFVAIQNVFEGAVDRIADQVEVPENHIEAALTAEGADVDESAADREAGGSESALKATGDASGV